MDCRTPRRHRGCRRGVHPLRDAHRRVHRRGLRNGLPGLRLHRGDGDGGRAKHEGAGSPLARGRRRRRLSLQLLHHVARVEPQDRPGADRPRGARRARQALRALPAQVVRGRRRPQHRVQVREPRLPASRAAGPLPRRRRVVRPEAHAQARLERGQGRRRRALAGSGWTGCRSRGSGWTSSSTAGCCPPAAPRCRRDGAGR